MANKHTKIVTKDYGNPELNRLAVITKMLEEMIPSERDRVMNFLAGKFDRQCPHCGEQFY